MIYYRIIYSNNSLSCLLTDPETVKGFAKYMTGKELYPVVIIKVKMK